MYSYNHAARSQKVRSVREIRDEIRTHHERLAETRRRMEAMEGVLFDDMIARHGLDFCLRLGAYSLEVLQSQR